MTMTMMKWERVARMRTLACFGIELEDRVHAGGERGGDWVAPVQGEQWDCIFTERLKFCDVNEKLILNKVLLLGSSSQTIIGRSIVPEAAVHAVVEEHELTKLRITDIQGIEKSENIVREKPSKAAKKQPEKGCSCCLSGIFSGLHMDNNGRLRYTFEF
ncbi:50S ribosomal protein L21, mitochondrial [Morella rubra]|uniref:Large ribosomal subunit protein bL21m n=1 Tax=Morella rubra TaxID=262757 RepID=A0A6A1WJW6_9ROSI|nr:50S ribosomal protein L21, mitochondrial [Morella rubra]